MKIKVIRSFSRDFKIQMQSELCYKARESMNQMQFAIKKSMGMADKGAANQMLSLEYIYSTLGITQQIWGGMPPQDQVGYLHAALAQCVHQLNAVNSMVNTSTQNEVISTDIAHMARIQKKVIKIQSLFRQRLAVIRLEKDIQKQKNMLASRSQFNKGVSSEKQVLQEFKQRLARKGLSPEAFYRVCDTQMRKIISLERFDQMLQSFRLQLSKA